MLDDLGRRGVRSVFVEGGPTVASAFVRLGLVDDYLVYLAPTLLGGALTALDDLGVATIDDQRRLRVAAPPCSAPTCWSWPATTPEHPMTDAHSPDSPSGPRT